MRSFAYATVSDIAARLPGATFTASSLPNASQVVELIVQTADELDAILADVKYSVPVPTTATAAFNLLAGWNSVGAAMYALGAKVQGQDSKQLPFLERRWTAILTDLRTGDTQLPGLSKDTTISLPRYPGAPAYAQGVATPYFTREPEGGV